MVYAFIVIAFVLGNAATFLFGRLSKYRALTIYEVAHDMSPIERDVLEEIVTESESLGRAFLGRIPIHERRRVRVHLETIKVRLGRILMNAARPKYWAQTDQRMMRRNRQEHPQEVVKGMKKLLQAERELRWLTWRVLFRVWLWNLSGFHIRDWGPMPDLRTFRIADVLRAYDAVKVATISVARSCGEAVIAVEIAENM